MGVSAAHGGIVARRGGRRYPRPMGKDLALRVGTIGDLVKGRRTIYMSCEKCGHQAEVDPAAVAGAHGENVPLQRFLERSYCSGCPARYPHIDLKAPPASRGGLPVR